MVALRIDNPTATATLLGSEIKSDSGRDRDVKYADPGGNESGR